MKKIVILLILLVGFVNGVFAKGSLGFSLGASNNFPKDKTTHLVDVSYDYPLTNRLYLVGDAGINFFTNETFLHSIVNNLAERKYIDETACSAVKYLTGSFNAIPSLELKAGAGINFTNFCSLELKALFGYNISSCKVEVDKSISDLVFGELYGGIGLTPSIYYNFGKATVGLSSDIKCIFSSNVLSGKSVSYLRPNHEYVGKGNPKILPELETKFNLGWNIFVKFKV